MKKCIKCQTIQPLENFHRKKTNSDGYDSRCKSCQKAYKAAFYSQSKEYFHERYRKRYLSNTVEFLKANANRKYKHRYGITTEEKNKMITDQKNKCAICQNNFKSTKDQCVDHNHQTKKVRAILCDRCNRVLGVVNDDFELLILASKYLLSFKEK